MERNKSSTPTSPGNFWDFDSKRSDNEEYVLERVSKNGSHLRDASKRLRNNKSVVMAAVRQKWIALTFASKDLRDDESICLEAISQDGYAMKFTGDKLRNDKRFVLSAVAMNGLSLKYASPEIRKDLVVVLEAVKQNGLAIEFFKPSTERMDEITRNILIQAVSNNGMALKFLPNEFKDNLHIVSTAVGQNGQSIEFASVRLKKKKEVCLEAVMQTGSVYKRLSDRTIRNDRKICLEAVRSDPTMLKDIADIHRNDREIVVYSIRSNGLMLQYTNAETRDDKEIVIIAVTNNGLALKFASRRLSYDREVVLTAVKNDGFALLYASRKEQHHHHQEEEEEIEGELKNEDLKNDIEVVRRAIENDPFSFKFASEELKSNNNKNNNNNTKGGEMLLKQVIKKMSLLIDLQRKMTAEERSLQRQKVIENASKRKSLPGLIEKKRRRCLDAMYYDRGIVYMKYYYYYHYFNSQKKSSSSSSPHFWEAFEDFIHSLVEIDKKNFYSDHVVDTESFNRVIEQISATAQKIMIQQIREEENWILKWTTPGINKKKKNKKKKRSTPPPPSRNNITSYYFFQRPMTEKEVEVKRKSICSDFVEKILGPSLQNIRDRWRDEVVKRIKLRCVNTLIAWYGPYDRKVAYLGVLSPLTQTPLGYGFEFHISQKYRSSKSLISTLKRNIYRLVFYGSFDEGGQRGGGQGREYDPRFGTLIFEGEYKFGKRWGKGREFSSNSMFVNNEDGIISPTDHITSSSSTTTTSTISLVDPVHYFVIFEGQYENGLRHGHGELYDEETREIVRGVWSAGNLKEVHSRYECPIIPFSSIEKHLRHDCIVGRGAYGIIYMLESKYISKKYFRRRRRNSSSRRGLKKQKKRRRHNSNISKRRRRRRSQILKKNVLNKNKNRHTLNIGSPTTNNKFLNFDVPTEEEEEENKKTTTTKVHDDDDDDEVTQFLDSEGWVAVKIFETPGGGDNFEHDFVRREFMFRNIKYAIELCGSVKDKQHILDVKAIIKGRQIGYLFELCKMSVDKIVPTISSKDEKIRVK